MPANAITCPHGRSWDACIRCDPWCPHDLTEERYDELQRLADDAHNAKLTASLRAGMLRHGEGEK